MSKHNKVNKSNYDQGGRLTPDELARENRKQTEAARGAGRERVSAKASEPSGARGDSRRRTSREE